MAIENFNERLKKCRKEKGLTQTKIAEKAGMGVATIIRYEKGERVPNLDVINQIAEALELPIDELLYNVPLPPSEEIQQALKKYSQYIISGKNQLNESFDKLNNKGKQKAVEYVTDLSEQEKYTKPDKNVENK